MGSKKIKNKNRAFESITKATQSRFGSKCDLIFRQYNVRYSVPLDFGASEAKPSIGDEYGTNFMKESFHKLPRTLKDMLDHLLGEINYDDRSTEIRTVGLIHPDLSSTLVELDRPTKYISRISRCKTLKISNSIAQFGSTVLPVMPTTSTSFDTAQKKFRSKHQQYHITFLK